MSVKSSSDRLRILISLRECVCRFSGWTCSRFLRQPFSPEHMDHRLRLYRRQDSPTLGRGTKFMIFGAHVIVYSKDAAADRAFFQEVLGFSSVDAGHGWLIFELPAAEATV